MTTLRIGILASALTGLLGASARGIVDNTVDCNATCDRYKECFDTSYDTGRCYASCKAKAKDPAFREQVVSCEDCIGDKTCSGRSFNCASECSGVLP